MIHQFDMWNAIVQIIVLAILVFRISELKQITALFKTRIFKVNVQNFSLILEI